MKQFLFFLSLAAPAFLFAQTYEWAHAYSGVGEGYGYAVTTDASGNVYTTGTFSDVSDFDPESGTLNLTPNGGYDVFVTKTSASGNLIWARSVGSGGNDIAFDIDVDAAGNVYITGMFHFQADFDPGVAEVNVVSNGGADVFILKLTAAGNFSWVKTVGGTEDDYGLGIALDAAGNIHTTGYFANTVDFNPGAGTANLTAAAFNAFVSKLDPSGNYLWARNLGGFGDEFPQAIALDATGNVYTTGGFRGTADFDPGPGTFNLTATDLYNDTYLSKLDASGNFVWAKRFGGEETDNGHAIVVDSQNNVYLAGEFRGVFDADPNAGTVNMFVSGPEDGFIVKLTAAGNYVWSRKLGGINDDAVYDMAIDETDRIYLTGYFQGTVDFDPGPGNYSLTSFVSQQDTYVCKLDGSGNFNWAVAVNGPHSGNIGFGIALGPDAVYATGGFLSSGDFNTGSGVEFLNSAGSNDVFLMKHSACDPVSGTATVTVCDSYTWIDGVTYTASNTTATHVLQSSRGCDSTVTLNLTLNHSTASVTNMSVCDSYTWTNGTTYTNSGTYLQTLTNSASCDSTATLNLTVHHSAASSLNQTACDAYTLNGTTYNTSGTYIQHVQTIHGCDSAITLNLTILHSTSSQTSVAVCESYTWTNGTTYTVSGVYTQTLTNLAGCDSVATLNLTIFQDATTTTTVAACQSYTWTDGVTYTTSGTYTQALQTIHGCDSLSTLQLTINTVVPNAVITQNGGTLTANATTGTYQWVDCNTGVPVPGATAQNFTPTENGSYAVLIDEGGCTDYSSCIVIGNVGLNELSEDAIGIYPNPSTGMFTVSVTEAVAVVVTDASGKVLLEQLLTEGENAIDLRAANGVYFLKAGGVVKKLILEK